jgi:hypothetical protein
MQHSTLQRWLDILAALPTILFFLIILRQDAYLPATIPARAELLASRQEFDFIGWTANALWLKTAQSALGEDRYLTPGAQTAVVREYATLLSDIQRREDVVASLYADPTVADPAMRTAALRAELSDLRARLASRQPLAEAILQQQVEAALASQGFTVGGRILPPVVFHFSALPSMLVISPRAVIRDDASVQLVAELTLEDKVALEKKTEQSLGVSALVVPLGGLGTFPTMIMESTSLSWVTEAVAHEWTHNYLMFHPLGLHYDDTPALRTINETVASFVGKRIAQDVMARAYGAKPAAYAPAAGRLMDVIPVFDFQKEMHTTRVEADRLLAAGQIEEAEAYMESRRQVFVQHGYVIRRLNQAYFAFYGAYADSRGERGEDPVGPTVEAFLNTCPTIGAFLRSISEVGSFAQLQEMVRSGAVCR